MNVTPEVNIKNTDLVQIFTYKKLYEVLDEMELQYSLKDDLDVIQWQDKSRFIIIPAGMTLDPRTPMQSLYDRIKQRDTDYHKVYKDRMGILVMTWEEEDAARHKKRDIPQEGLPEKHALSSGETKGV